MSYVDAYVLAVPKDKVKEYKAFSESMLHLWMDNGCISYVECMGDDVPKGETTSFPRAVQATDDEVVMIGWRLGRDKATRDAANAKMMQSPPPEGPMPFDSKRMFWGGFQPIIERGKGL